MYIHGRRASKPPLPSPRVYVPYFTYSLSLRKASWVVRFRHDSGPWVGTGEKREKQGSKLQDAVLVRGLVSSATWGLPAAGQLSRRRIRNLKQADRGHFLCRLMSLDVEATAWPVVGERGHDESVSPLLGPATARPAWGVARGQVAGQGRCRCGCQVHVIRAYRRSRAEVPRRRRRDRRRAAVRGGERREIGSWICFPELRSLAVLLVVLS